MRPLISVKQALNLVLEKHSFVSKPASLPLMESLGCILERDLKSPEHFPPYDRVTMDGIAIYSEADLIPENTIWQHQETQLAGQNPCKLRQTDNCIELMTGSVLPFGCNTVIRYEDLDEFEKEGDRFYKLKLNVKRGINIHSKGSDLKKNEVLLSRGIEVNPAVIASLTSAGITEVPVLKPIDVCIFSTGDELVPPNQKPLPHQIRSSNEFVLEAGFRQIGVRGKRKHLPDDRRSIRNAINEVSNNELLVFSGGVSKGKADFLPETLVEMGFDIHFHGVAQRPGKPLLFASRNKQLVFGLPGNPASAMFCFYKYIRSLFRPHEHRQHYALAEEFQFEKELHLFQAVKLESHNGTSLLRPIKGNGSGDFISVSQADGMVEFAAEEKIFLPEQKVYPYIPFR